MNFSTALIAGGRSSRMGRDKCLLDFHGRPLWRRQLELLAMLKPAELLVSCREDQQYFLGEGALDARLIPDRHRHAGPLGGLASVFPACLSEFVVGLAVDLPRMEPGPLEFLLGHCSNGRGAIFQNGAYFEPLAAVYPTSLASLAADQLARNQLRLQEFVRLAIEQRQMTTLPLPEQWRHCFQNLNEPKDLEISNL